MAFWRRMARTAVLLSLLLACATADANSYSAPYFSGGARPPTRVGYQGEPGAYSEKALRALLGPNVAAVGYNSFEEVFQAVANHEVDFACLPIENSLGGSIHANYDLLLRYKLHIIAEHEFRVEHSLLALPGTKREDITKVYSHQQALAQTANYIRQLGAMPIQAPDTAGSARRIAEEKEEGAAAVASDLAAKCYGLEVVDSNIEDDDSNYTRFMLLGREPVSSLLPSDASRRSECKTSIVFTLPNAAGALYKALACFSLRDIDLCKIESRPTSVQLLQVLKYQSKRGRGSASAAGEDLPRFRYCFYLDFLGAQAEPRVRAALDNLKEQSTFLRVLGSFPARSRLVGPVQEIVAGVAPAASAAGPSATGRAVQSRLRSLSTPRLLEEILPGDAANGGGSHQRAVSSPRERMEPLRVGVVGLSTQGRFLAGQLQRMGCTVSALRQGTSDAKAPLDGADGGVRVFAEGAAVEFLRQDLDLILLAVPPLELEAVLAGLPLDLFRGRLVADTCRAKVFAKDLLLKMLPLEADLLCAHPMFGPWTPAAVRGKWEGLPFMYERVRCRNQARASRFLGLFEQRRCHMVEMSCEEHDDMSLAPQFMSELLGRAVARQPEAVPTLIDSEGGGKEMLRLADNARLRPHEDFYALYRLYPGAVTQIQRLASTLSEIRAELAQRDGYDQARKDLTEKNRSELLQECRALLQEAMLQGGAPEAAVEDGAAKGAGRAARRERLPTTRFSRIATVAPGSKSG